MVLIKLILDLINIGVVVIQITTMDVQIYRMLVKNNLGIRSEHAKRVVVFDHEICTTTQSDIIAKARYDSISIFTTDNDIAILASLNEIIRAHSRNDTLIDRNGLGFDNSIPIVRNVFVCRKRHIQVEPKLGIVTIDKVLVVVATNSDVSILVMFFIEYKRTIVAFFIATVTRDNLNRSNHRQVLRALSAERDDVLDANISNIACNITEHDIIADNLDTRSCEIVQGRPCGGIASTIGFLIITVKLMTRPIIQITILSGRTISSIQRNLVQIVVRIRIVVVTTKIHVQVIRSRINRVAGITHKRIQVQKFQDDFFALLRRYICIVQLGIRSIAIDFVVIFNREAGRSLSLSIHLSVHMDFNAFGNRIRVRRIRTIAKTVHRFVIGVHIALALAVSRIRNDYATIVAVEVVPTIIHDNAGSLTRSNRIRSIRMFTCKVDRQDIYIVHHPFRISSRIGMDCITTNTAHDNIVTVTSIDFVMILEGIFQFITRRIIFLAVGNIACRNTNRFSGRKRRCRIFIAITIRKEQLCVVAEHYIIIVDAMTVVFVEAPNLIGTGAAHNYVIATI